MIENIPSERDFLETGLSLLDFSWGIAMELLTDLDQAHKYADDTLDSGMVTSFWKASVRRLMVACAVAQQAVEFVLKSRIAAVSPFLLIAGSPREWPKSSDSAGAAFADFRTIDAQDLVRVHDSVASQRLPAEFVRRYDELRKRRNVIMHTVDSRLAVQVTDVVVDMLQMYTLLFPSGNWVKARREFQEGSPLAQLYSMDFVEERMVWEFHLVLQVLTPRQVRDFFGVPMRQRHYLCPECARICEVMDVVPKTAVLRPNSAESKSVYCFVCDQVTPVERSPCSAEGCQGNVICEEDGTCLTCGQESA